MLAKLGSFPRSLLFAAFCGALYGLALQFFARVFIKNSPQFGASVLVMSLAYVLILPVVIGMVHVYIRSRTATPGYVAAVFEPMLPALLCLAVSFAVNWEGTICLIMALPLMLALTALGGVIMRIVVGSKSKHLVFAAFTIMPIPLSFAEQSIPLPQEKQIVSNTIHIKAPARRVWEKIVRVEKITEPQQSLFFTLGFPKPVEAILSGNGVGQTRLATFERGLQFVETVTVWRENEKLAFTIKADPKATPLTTLDEHVTVGGAFFDVLSGVYEIEYAGDGVYLKLYSEHRISTHFNFYARLWSRYLMGEIQENILKVIKKRAESKA